MYNHKDYKKKNWYDYRLRVWEADNHRCVRCGKEIGNPRRAQIHHKIYLPNLFPWEYDETDCECLCASCHLEEHGRKMPTCDWIYIGCTTFDKYGDTTCDLCGSELKYEHEIWHPLWGTLYVGIGCCDNLTSTNDKQEMRRQQNYLKRISNIEKWSYDHSQMSWQRNFDGYALQIKFEEGFYRIYVEGRRGKSTHSTFKEAIEQLSNIIYFGEIDEIFRLNHIQIPEARLKKLRAYDKKKEKLHNRQVVEEQMDLNTDIGS